MSGMSDKFDLSSMIADVTGAYLTEVQEAVDAAAEKAAEDLVKLTKQTAPYDEHSRNAKRKKHYRNSIAYQKRTTAVGLSSYIWYVKGADYRLTHLLVNGHQARDGSRVRGNPFLKNACEEVFPKFLAEVEGAVKPK